MWKAGDDLDSTFAAAKLATDSFAELLSTAKFPIDKIDTDIKEQPVSYC